MQDRGADRMTDPVRPQPGAAWEAEPSARPAYGTLRLQPVTLAPPPESGARDASAADDLDPRDLAGDRRKGAIAGLVAAVLAVLVAGGGAAWWLLPPRGEAPVAEPAQPPSSTAPPAAANPAAPEPAPPRQAEAAPERPPVTLQ
jgi:hypothetical protein